MSVDAMPSQTPNPWPGLLSYTEADKERFFGRDGDIAELLRMIERDRLTVLFGRSGMGKTSLLRAGVGPRLRDVRLLPIFVRIDYSGEASDPVVQVKETSVATARANGIEWNWTAGPPQADATLWEFFCSAELWGARNDVVTPVLVLDQFEEAFTIGRSTPRTCAFLEQLADLAENRAPSVLRERALQSGERVSPEGRGALYKVLLSLREDYVSELDGLRPVMPAILRNRLRLRPFDRSKARSVVLGAGRAWVSDEVADVIVNAVAGAVQPAGREESAGSSGGEIEPAYLSVMCHELFQSMVASGRTVITAEAVAQEHASILEALYERSFAGLDARVRSFVENDLLTASGFRSTLPVADALRNGVTMGELDALVNCRLLRFEDRLGTRHVELSHDLLTPVVRASRDRRRTEEELRQEHTRSERLMAEQLAARRRQRIAVVVAALFGIALVGSLYGSYYLFFAEHSAYFEAFTKRRGFFFGLNERTLKDVRRAACSYQLVWRGVRWSHGLWPEWNPPHTVVAVNENLEPTNECALSSYLSSGDTEEAGKDEQESQKDDAAEPSSRKFCRCESVRDAYGGIAYEQVFDTDGHMVWAFVYSPAGPGQVRSRMARFVGADGFPQLQRRDSAAEYVVIEYDDDGWEKQIGYRDRLNRPVIGPSGAFGERREYDATGRVTLRVSMDVGGRPMVDRAGNAGMRYIYDAAGHVKEMQSVGPDMKPMPVKDGFTITRMSPDALGRPTRLTYWDSSGSAVLTRDGFHGFEQSFDERGRVIETRWFGLDERATLTVEGVASQRRWYSPTGLLLKETAYGVRGEPVVDASGCHGTQMIYDNAGRLKEKTCISTEERPLAREGLASTRYEYDRRGNLAKYTFHGESGEPVQGGEDGVHGWLMGYDDGGRPLIRTRIGVDGRPATRDEGYSTIRSVYDQRGNEIERTYYGPGGDRVTVKDGTHGWRAEYDDVSNRVSKEFLDTLLRPVVCNEGYAKEIRAYDSGRHVIEARFFDKDGGTPALVARGQYHRATAVYNEFGKMTESAAYGLVGEPILAEGEGYHLVKAYYDPRGYEIERSFWGTDRTTAALEAETRAHMISTTPNLRGQPERRRYFGVDLRPVLSKSGFHAESWKYDSMGREVSHTWEGVEGQPLALDEGFATYRVEYNARGQQVRKSYYGVHGEPVLEKHGNHGWERTYDDRGQLLIHTWTGLHDESIVLSDGFATIRFAYKHGKEAESTFFGADGQPVVNGRGFHRRVWDYDEHGRSLGPSRCLDLAGKRVPCVRCSVLQVSAVDDGEGKRAGVMPGDVIWGYDEWKLLDGTTLPDAKKAAEEFMTRTKRPGQRWRQLVVIRGGGVTKLAVHPGPLNIRLRPVEIGESVLLKK